jgi:hypothetical protein
VVLVTVGAADDVEEVPVEEVPVEEVPVEEPVELPLVDVPDELDDDPEVA